MHCVTFSKISKVSEALNFPISYPDFLFAARKNPLALLISGMRLFILLVIVSLGLNIFT